MVMLSATIIASPTSRGGGSPSPKTKDEGWGMKDESETLESQGHTAVPHVLRISIIIVLWG